MPDADAGRNHTQATRWSDCAGDSFLAAGRPPCGPDPDILLSAIPHPFGVDAGDAARRRLAVRVEILLWVQPLFVAVLFAVVHGAHPCHPAAAGRHCGLSAAA